MITKTKLGIFAATLLMASIGTVKAATVSFTLTGIVDFDLTFSGTNAFGLFENDLITATGTFDSSEIGNDLVNGSGSIDISTITDLVITVGSQVFTDLDDNGSGLLIIQNGTALDGLGAAGLVYSGTNGAGNLFTSDASDNFTGNSDVLGTWTTFNMTVVPVPAAVWLFGTGLIGLVGVARRKMR